MNEALFGQQRQLLQVPAAVSLRITSMTGFLDGQAVGIPAVFRLATDRVQITRNPSSDLVIHPCPASA
ncbi:hypothetical protein KBZ33_19755 [Cyanobium sp. Cruz-8D1]|uniref:hypothetical protein n=1 Tax=Cyanobium sp. Cruz-8D1 TaxID=2823711 RepID=UPI0020CF4DA3|nr:hypothetical protein [Cyanobium sp. Cruz-8D1]MCP9861247.1 hypothetical protein [Cyanobium sp. Cruz-8H5]MCP9868495.1 hypothetical protein [Cyanobium sp. Cruz-8D1]